MNVPRAVTEAKRPRFQMPRGSEAEQARRIRAADLDPVVSLSNAWSNHSLAVCMLSYG